MGDGVYQLETNRFGDLFYINFESATERDLPWNVIRSVSNSMRR